MGHGILSGCSCGSRIMAGGITGNKIQTGSQWKGKAWELPKRATLDPGENPWPRNPVPSCPVLIEPRFSSQPTTFISLFLYQPPQLNPPVRRVPVLLPAITLSYLPRSRTLTRPPHFTTHIVGLSLRVIDCVVN